MKGVGGGGGKTNRMEGMCCACVVCEEKGRAAKARGCVCV